MCLGVPGKIKEIYTVEKTRMGKVDFDGVALDVCLEAVLDAEIGDYVIVHAGFAISILSQDEAAETLKYLKKIDEINLQLLTED